MDALLLSAIRKYRAFMPASNLALAPAKETAPGASSATSNSNSSPLTLLFSESHHSTPPYYFKLPSKAEAHSERRLFTGFASAALIDKTEIVSSVHVSTRIPGTTIIHH
jgi:hypothetical protein